MREEYEEARGLHQQSLDIFERLGEQRGRASSLHQLGIIAQDQGEYEEARYLYQQSLDIKERLGNQSGQANSLGQLGMLTYQQRNFEKALTYMIQTYILFDALGSPHRAFAQRMITEIRDHMDEETFMTQWRTLAGDQPLVAVVEQEETEDTHKDEALAILKLLGVISSVILQGTLEERLQLASYLPMVQKQLPPELAMLEGFFEHLAEALKRETPEAALVLWQAFTDGLNGNTTTF